MIKGVILSGGSGTRLRPLTHTGPKQLIPIANKPNILYCIEDLRNAGIKELCVILGDNMPGKVKELLKDGSDFGVGITYIEQGAPRGIAHAVACARLFVGKDPFVVYLGDNIIRGGIKEMVKDFKENKYNSAVALCKVKDPQRFGVAELDKNGKIISLEEKPKKPKSDFALTGIYFFTPLIFDMIKTLKPSWRGELEITDAIHELVKRKYRVHAYTVDGWWKDTGKPEDILEANHLVLDDLVPYNKGKIVDGTIVKGRVGIGENTTIYEGSVVRGPVIIGKNCKIGPNTYIGPYTSIGDNSIIANSEIEASIIIGDCKIDCGNKIIDSLIGRSSVISSVKGSLPKGHRLVLGENSFIQINE